MAEIQSPSEAHKESAPDRLRIAIITVSSSRSLNDDISGGLIKDMLKAHVVTKYIVVKDSAALIRNEVHDTILDSFNPVDVIIVNGGTGIAKSDVTIEAIAPILDKEYTGFNAIFSCMSFESIGSPAFLSRATAGCVRGVAVFCVPGSPDACKLAMERLILPEMGHVVKHLRE
jgi:molybdopterin adenylyltransferase